MFRCSLSRVVICTVITGLIKFSWCRSLRESDSSDDNFIAQSSFSGNIQSSCEEKSLSDAPADHYDGLDVKETDGDRIIRRSNAE